MGSVPINMGGIVVFVGVLLAGIMILGVGADIMQDLDNEHITNTTTSVTNQTITGSNTTAVTLRGHFVDDSTVKVTNASNGYLLNSANYTIAEATPSIIMVGPRYHTVSVNVTYSYINVSSDTVAEIYGNGTLGVANISEKLPITATVFILAVVLSVVLAGIYFKKFKV